MGSFLTRIAFIENSAAVQWTQCCSGGGADLLPQLPSAYLLTHPLTLCQIENQIKFPADTFSVRISPLLTLSQFCLFLEFDLLDFFL